MKNKQILGLLSIIILISSIIVVIADLGLSACVSDAQGNCLNQEIQILNTKFHTRGNVELTNLINFDNYQLTSTRGKYNINHNSGHIYIQGKDADDNRHRLSIKWNKRGNKYGLSIVSNTANEIIINANARLIHNGNVEYNIPTEIIYNKITEEITIRTLDGRFIYS